MNPANRRGPGTSPQAVATRALTKAYREKSREVSAGRLCPECGVPRLNDETLRAHRYIAHGVDL